MPCSICKETGHTKSKCPTKVSVVEPEITTGEATTINIDNTSELWTSLSAQSYDNFQPIDELIDNAIAAIIPAKNGDIYTVFDFDANVGSIEHSGGVTFPTDPAGISRCFTVGGKQPTSLNEHGCGLKSSLAILDPTNTSWEIWIKSIVDGNLVIRNVSAPYKNGMTLTVESSWPGQNKNSEPGSFIRFPLKKERFRSLYTKDDAKMGDLDLHKRISNHLSHMWMKQEDVRSSRIRHFYNGVLIKPFSFHSENVYDSSVASIIQKTFSLSTGAKVDIEEIKIRQGIKSIEGSSMFKYSMNSTGVVVFKNGRLIEFINGNQFGRNLYTYIFGCSPHNNYNGHIRLVNMIGTQDQLPATVPTKNRFQDETELFVEFLNGLRDNLTPYTKPEHISEDSMVSDYKREREGTMAAMGIVCSLEQEKVFTVDGESTPRMDLVCTHGDTIDIMEFKARSKVQLDDLSQLMANWMLAKAANPTKGVRPVLVLFGSDAPALTSAHRQYLHIFKEMCGFAPIIRTNKNIPLYPSP